MLFLVLTAYIELLRFHIYLTYGNFQSLHRTVSRHALGSDPPAGDIVRKICSAVDVACIWYWKEVLCLQRSAATVCLLKSYGVPAELVIGAQLLPFRAHAWVEVNGLIVNDKPYLHEIYAVLERC